MDRRLIRQANALSIPFPGFYGKKVAAVAASEAGEFIASGYNQTTRGSKKRPILGAVENMVEGATRESKSLYGSVIYLTEPPCLTSAKAIWETGAFRVVYPKGKGGASRIAATKLLAKLGVMLTEFS